MVLEKMLWFELAHLSYAGFVHEPLNVDETVRLRCEVVLWSSPKKPWKILVVSVDRSQSVKWRVIIKAKKRFSPIVFQVFAGDTIPELNENIEGVWAFEPVLLGFVVHFYLKPVLREKMRERLLGWLVPKSVSGSQRSSKTLFSSMPNGGHPSTRKLDWKKGLRTRKTHLDVERHIVDNRFWILSVVCFV